MVPLAPTAQTSVEETAATLERTSLMGFGPGLGLFTTLHSVPFQCSVSVFRAEELLAVKPTAQTSFEETAATLRNSLLIEPGLGLVTTLHFVPFQCSVNVCVTPAVLTWNPTAHTSLLETALTAYRVLSIVPGLGLVTTLQPVPFQCSVTVTCPLT